MFRLNLATFRDRPVMRERYGGELEAMARHLDELVDSADTTPITWQMRQIALRTAEGGPGRTS